MLVATWLRMMVPFAAVRTGLTVLKAWNATVVSRLAVDENRKDRVVDFAPLDDHHLEH